MLHECPPKERMKPLIGQTLASVKKVQIIAVILPTHRMQMSWHCSAGGSWSPLDGASREK